MRVEETEALLWRACFGVLQDASLAVIFLQRYSFLSNFETFS